MDSNQSQIKNNMQANYSIILNNQSKLSLTGIQEVISTNDKMLILKTNGKKLTISGNDINITKLIVDTGEMEATGTFDSIKYDKTFTGNIFKRFFK